MSTPVAKEETLEQIAERITRTHFDVIAGVSLTKRESQLSNAILSALHNEREACAKVAESHKTILCGCPEHIAAAIRERTE